MWNWICALEECQLKEELLIISNQLDWLRELNANILDSIEIELWMLQE